MKELLISNVLLSVILGSFVVLLSIIMIEKIKEMKYWRIKINQYFDSVERFIRDKGEFFDLWYFENGNALTSKIKKCILSSKVNSFEFFEYKDSFVIMELTKGNKKIIFTLKKEV